VAYVLKGFPVLSETFISSEVYRVEQTGIPLHIFVVKPRDEREHHPVIDRIRATPDYLPPTSRISEKSRLRWLLANAPQFVPSLVRTLRRRPKGVLAAARLALGESVLARSSFWSWPKVSYVRDLLLALAIADRLFHSPHIRHLHAHFAHDSTTITWLASMITGLPFSFTAHAKDIYADRLNPRGLLPRKLHAATFVVTCTEANRRHLERMSDGTPIHRVYHGLNDDFRRFSWDCHTTRREPAQLRLLAVGRLVRKKGLDIFVEACGLLDSQGVRFEAVIIGDDDDVGDKSKVSEDLRRRITRLGLEDRVRMLGQLGQREVYDHYLNASVFCLPCRVLDDGDRDGIPNVLLEAMSCGIPVVTTGVSGIPELVEHGINGLLVDEEDPGALAGAVGMLAADPELAHRLGRAGRATVNDRFDGDVLAGRLAGLFERMIR
jgi:glycosyltransferase involved in cell wall biosynthesis